MHRGFTEVLFFVYLRFSPCVRFGGPICITVFIKFTIIKDYTRMEEQYSAKSR